MTLPGTGATDFDGDGASDYQETQTAQYRLRPDLSDLISKPTGIEVVPKPGMDFTAALSESHATAHQDGGHNTSPGGQPGDHGWQQPVDHITELEVQYHGADPPPPPEQTADHITKLGVQFHPTDHGSQVEGTVDQPPFGSGAIIATADPTDIPPRPVHVEADTHAVHPPHPSVTADVADVVGPVEHAAPVEQVELVAHSEPGPTPAEHLHTEAIG